MYKFLGLLFCAGLLVIGAYAQQRPIVIEHLEISLWPEYDDPRLLVIYRGELAQDPQGPLLFSIPLDAEIHAVAYVSADGRLLANKWQLLPGDDRQQLVTFAPGSRRFQLEYYADAISTQPQKSFSFRFQSQRYEVKELEIEVQQPLRSGDFVATPPLEDRGADSRGLRYFGRKAGSVPAGALIEQQISYSKSDMTPSVQPASPEGLSSWPLILMIAIGVLAVGVGGAAWLWRGRAQMAPSKRSALRQQSLSTAEMRFCAGCGHEFRAAEQFCPRCGQPRA